MKVIVVLIFINLLIIRYETINVQAIDAKPNLILFGDSITDANWINKPSNYFYSNILSNWWNNSFDVINSGIAGSCLKDVNIQKRIAQYHPKYVIIMYGLNDVARYQDPNNFYTYYNDILDEIIKQNPNITIFICKTTWINSTYTGIYGKYSENLQIEFNERIEQIAKERNMILIDVWNKSFHNSSLTWDGAHTNEKGAGVIASTFNETLYSLLNNNPFAYIDEIKVERKSNVNLQLNLNLNVRENDNEKEYNVDFMFLSFILSISLVFAVSVILFEERRKERDY